MSDGFDFDLDHQAIDRLGFDDDVEDMLEEVGGIVADLAAEKAPKKTGEGAASIHGEVDADDESAYVDVSWDPDHFYMYFAEVGSERQPATPFLRPALYQAEI